MLIMGAHEMMTLGAAVGGTVDGPSFDPNELCDGDTDTPVRTAAGSGSFLISGVSTAIDGLVVAGHNFETAQEVAFSGLGTVIMPTAPPGGIRFNGFLRLSPAVTASETTVSFSGGPASGAVISEIFAGIFREVRTLPPRSGMPWKPFEIIPDDEYGGLSYSKGGQARRYGGTVLLDDAAHLILQNAYLASQENSFPTVIIPFEDVNDAWVVTWNTFIPRQDSPGLWADEVEWEELPRYRHA